MSGRMREIGKMRRTAPKNEPYCGYRRARKSPVRIGRTFCPFPSWHRPAGIAKMERRATLKALKVATRQAAKAEIRNAIVSMEGTNR